MPKPHALLVELVVALSLLPGLYGHADVLTALDGPAYVIQSVIVGQSRLIEVCHLDQCTLFPHANAPLYGFAGSNAEWVQWFTECKNFEQLNNLYIGTDLVASAALASVGVGVPLKTATALWWIGNSRVVRYLLNAGLAGLSPQVYAQAKGSSLPFPEISATEVKAVSGLLSVALQTRARVLPLNSDVLRKLESVLTACSTGFTADIDRRELLLVLASYQKTQDQFASQLVTSRSKPQQRNFVGELAVHSKAPDPQVILDYLQTRDGHRP